MREILFRGKRIDNGEWVYGTLFEISDAHDPFIMFKNQHGISEQVSRETVGQYAGLKDKDGKRIFEGDVAVSRNPRTLSNKPFEIKMQPVTGGFGYWKLDKPEFIEVIGNIHDNPELIGGTENA